MSACTLECDTGCFCNSNFVRILPGERCVRLESCPDWTGFSECQQQAMVGNYMTSVGIFDVFTPSCEPSGDFSSVQCNRGGCWCVYRDGTEIIGTHSLNFITYCPRGRVHQ